MSKLLVASALLGLCACIPPSALRARLERVEAAVGKPADGPRYLRYEVSSPSGDWEREAVVLDGAYAERRTRQDDGSRYAFGHDARGSWIRLGDGETLADPDPVWTAESHTQAAILGLAFARPEVTQDADYLGRSQEVWELAVHVAGARPLTLSVDRTTGLPAGFDSIDAYGRVENCDELGFARRAIGSVLVGARCSATLGGKHHPTSASFHLDEARALDPKSAPAWAVPASRRASPPLTGPVVLPIVDPLRPKVPVAFGDHPPRQLTLDSGAFDVLIDGAAARELGVVPTDELPLYEIPPWLRASRLWVGVVGTFRIGELELHGQRVLVAETMSFGDTIGLLGQTFFRKVLVDVDSPAKKLRFWARNQWKPEPGMVGLHLRGEGSVSVHAKVLGVASGELTLDTGMEEEIVVTDYQMAVKHPRERGRDASLGGGDTSQSPDYYSRIDGLRIGPFELPAMDAVGRDRQRERVGADLGLAGMGVMRLFRLVFDARQGTVYVTPGPAYHALRRAGFEVEDQDGAVVVTRVVDAARTPLKVNDVLRGVRGRAVRSADEARAAIAAAPSRWLDVEAERRGTKRKRTFEIAPPEL